MPGIDSPSHSETAPERDAPGQDREPSTDEGREIQTPAHGDPVVRMLILALLGGVVLFLVAIVSAMVFGFLRPPQAPRTLAEKNLATYGVKVDAKTADAKTWASYIAALIDAGQLSKAKEVLAAASKSAQSDKSFLLVQQARLQYVTKDYAGCVKTSDRALVEAEKELELTVAELKAKGITQSPEKSRPKSWLAAAHLKGDALAEMKDTAGAIKTYDAYLKVSPTDADILAVRGRLRARQGDKAGAEKDFREALRFIPDYQPALDGLKEIGAAAK